MLPGMITVAPLAFAAAMTWLVIAGMVRFQSWYIGGFSPLMITSAPIAAEVISPVLRS